MKIRAWKKINPVNTNKESRSSRIKNQKHLMGQKRLYTAKDDIQRKISHRRLCTRLCTNIVDKYIRQKSLKNLGENNKTTVGDFNKLFIDIYRIFIIIFN